MERTDTLNIVRFKPLITLEEIKKEFPNTDEVSWEETEETIRYLAR